MDLITTAFSACTIVRAERKWILINREVKHNYWRRVRGSL
jgi:hypothetical protein